MPNICHYKWQKMSLLSYLYRDVGFKCLNSERLFFWVHGSYFFFYWLWYSYMLNSDSDQGLFSIQVASTSCHIWHMRENLIAIPTMNSIQNGLCFVHSIFPEFLPLPLFTLFHLSEIATLLQTHSICWKPINSLSPILSTIFSVKPFEIPLIRWNLWWL